MLDESYAFPSPVREPQSIKRLLSLGFQAYISNFRFCTRLFLFPVFVMTASSLFFTLFGEEPSEGGDHIKTAISWTWWLTGLTIFGYCNVVRSIALQRMLLLPEVEFVSAIAFANRNWRKRFLVRVATCILQAAALVVFCTIGCVAWHFLPKGSIQFVGAATAMFVLSCLTWCYAEYFYDCFSIKVSLHRCSWGVGLADAFALLRKGIFRSCRFELLILLMTFGLPVFLKPETLYYLPQIGKIGILGCIAPDHTSLFLRMSGDAFTFVFFLIAVPLNVIFSAYFVNDMRLRSGKSILEEHIS